MIVSLEQLQRDLKGNFIEQQIIVRNINAQLRGRDVILKCGRYKNRRAQIQNYYFDHGKQYVHLFIYRLDSRAGFRGKEKFIDDHQREFVELQDCELL